MIFEFSVNSAIYAYSCGIVPAVGITFNACLINKWFDLIWVNPFESSNSGWVNIWLFPIDAHENTMSVVDFKENTLRQRKCDTSNITCTEKIVFDLPKQNQK